MFCINCGNKIIKDAKFCDKCGAKTENDGASTDIQKKVNQQGKHKSLLKILMVVFVLGIIVILLVARGNISKNGATNILSDSSKKNSLEAMYHKIDEIDKSGNVAAYYELLTPSDRSKMTKDAFIKMYSQAQQPFSIQTTVHSIEVSGDRGVIDRTRIVCSTQACDSTNRTESRVKKEYFYINGNWFATLDNTIYCERTEEYVYPEEFKRAISLILQRRGESKLQESVDVSKDFKKIKNCLDIQYASSDSEMIGAEGLFAFDSNSSPERLQIFISPRYKVKDDLLTALLLIHEMHHAYLHTSGIETSITCYENEAEAFTQSLGLFFFDFNKEEQDSIINRYSTSPEAKDFIDLWSVVSRNDGDYIYDRVLPIVKANPFYQKQCSQS